MRRALSVTAVVVAASLLVPTTAQAIDDIDSVRLRKLVNASGILAHERVFQRIANENGGIRASGTPGYDASVEYVRKTMTRAGYQVSLQAFDFAFFQELVPSEFEQVDPNNVQYESLTMTYSGSGEVVGNLVPTKDVLIPPPEVPGSTSGCEASDFKPASATQPEVALIQRGTCFFSDKAANAQAAGYDAVVIFNEGQPGRTDVLAGTLGAPFDIPVIGVSFATGRALFKATQAGKVTVRVATSTVSETRTTQNVIADSVEGDPDEVIVVGAHLDSVIAGPGINDNGSGSAALLEIAVQLQKLGFPPRRQVRFAFWGAEELGLLGSTYYVDNLSGAQLGKIYANLNFDMVGSSNYVRFVYDGDGSDSDPAGPPGSAQIEDIFTGYFDSQDLASDPTPFSGRSDYGPFIAVGIPAGGLFTGAEGIKTEEQAAVYGGTAGVAYHECYHLACDTIDSNNTQALGEMGDAAAHAVRVLSRSRTGLFEDGSKPARTPVPAATFDYQGGLLVR